MIGKFDAEIKRFENRADQVVDKTIANNLEEKFKKYEKVRLGFEMFFDQQEFLAMLTRKADKEYLHQ